MILDCPQTNVTNSVCNQLYPIAMTGIIIAVIVFVLIIIIHLATPQKQLISSTRIYSLQTKQRIKGRFSNVFFIGSGYIDQSERYFFYVKGEKGFILNNVDAYNTEIIESEKKEPTLEEWAYKGEGNKFFMYVPKGTIYKEFDSKIQ